MHPILTVSRFQFGAYGLLVVAGALVGMLVTWALADQKREEVPVIVIFVLAFAVLGSISLAPGARLVWAAFHPGEFEGYGLGAFGRYLAGTGEMVFLGGLLGAAFGALLYGRWFSRSLAHLAGPAFVALPLAHAIGRVGCFLGGCCYGIQVSPTNPLAVIYPPYPAFLPQQLAPPSGVALLDVPLMECAFLLLLASVNFIHLRACRKAGKGNANLCLEIYCLAYGIWRFSIEFFRGDAIRGIYGGVSTSQYICVLLVAFGIALLARRARRERPAQ